MDKMTVEMKRMKRTVLKIAALLTISNAKQQSTAYLNCGFVMRIQIVQMVQMRKTVIRKHVDLMSSSAQTKTVYQTIGDVTVKMTVEIIQMKKTANPRHVLSKTSSVQMEIAFLQSFGVMVNMTVQMALMRDFVKAGAQRINFSVQMGNVYLPSGDVMVTKIAS